MGRLRSIAGRSILPLLLAFVSACVADVDGPSPTDPHGVTTTTTLVTTTVTVSRQEGLADYRECMSGMGVEIPLIPTDALGRPRMADALKHLDLADRQVQDALEACGSHLEDGALDLATDPELQELVQSALQDLATCMRARGVEDFPDPVPGFAGLGAPFPSERIPWADPDLADAVRTCSRDLS